MVGGICRREHLRTAKPLTTRTRRMRFNILGPFEVWSQDRLLDLGGRGQEVLLAVLLLQARRTVTNARLIEALWPDGPPLTAVSQVRDRIRRLRRTLRDHEESTSWLIVTRSGGYAIDPPLDSLDTTMFEQHVARASQALSKQRLQAGADHLASALALWRGMPLQGFDVPALLPEFSRWEETWLSAWEQWAETCLRLAQYTTLVPELARMTASCPLRERLHFLYAVALLQSGRRAEALAACLSLQATLEEEMGVGLHGEMERLYRSLLHGDTSTFPLPYGMVASEETGARRSVVGSRVEVAPLAGVRQAEILAGKIHRLSTESLMQLDQMVDHLLRIERTIDK